jgi:hypothetical protein
MRKRMENERRGSKKRGENDNEGRGRGCLTKIIDFWTVHARILVWGIGRDTKVRKKWGEEEGRREEGEKKKKEKPCVRRWRLMRL